MNRNIGSIIQNHYHINGDRCLDDLTQREKLNLSIALLEDFNDLDPAEAILFDTEEKKNIMWFLREYYVNKITADEFIESLVKLVIDKNRSAINEEFDELINQSAINAIYDGGDYDLYDNA